MRLNIPLLRQHLGRFTKLHWYIQGKKVIKKTAAETHVLMNGHEVLDGVKEVRQWEREPKGPMLTLVGMYDRPIPFDENHPEYQAEPCWIIKDTDVLVEGFKQAQIFTNTVKLTDGLPQQLLELQNSLSVPEDVHEEVKRKAQLSCMFEATQVKLPKFKNPLRPHWKYPRNYGISDSRKNELMCKNLASVLESCSGAAQGRSQIVDAFVAVPLVAFGKTFQLELTSELMITSSQALPPLSDPGVAGREPLPDIFPVHPTVSIKQYHFFDFDDVFPIVKADSKWPHFHTALVHFNATQVVNEYDAPVTEDQRKGRCLLKGFALAAAQARAKYGANVQGDLPAPITVQVVQTDGQEFYFSVYQLNTLKMDADPKEASMRNVYWDSPPLLLYDQCCYSEGRPVLENYNPTVFNRLLAFYNHN